MLLKKTALASLVALALTGCGSSGGGNGGVDQVTTNKVTTNTQVSEKASKEATDAKVAAEKAQAAKEEAEKILKDALAAKQTAEATLKQADAAKSVIEQAQADKTAAENAIKEATETKIAAEKTLQEIKAAQATIEQAQKEKIAAEKALNKANEVLLEVNATKAALEKANKEAIDAKAAAEKAQAAKEEAEKILKEALAAKQTAEATLKQADVAKSVVEQAQADKTAAENAIKEATATKIAAEKALNKANEVLLEVNATKVALEKARSDSESAHQALHDAIAAKDKAQQKLDNVMLALEKLKAALTKAIEQQIQLNEEKQSLRQQAQDAGLSDADRFAEANVGKSKSEVAEALKAELAKQEKRSNIKKQAEEAGLSPNDAETFAREHLDDEPANIQKLLEDKAEVNNKRQALIDMAALEGLGSNEANQFAQDHLNDDKETAKRALVELLENNERKAAELEKKKEAIANLFVEAELNFSDWQIQNYIPYVSEQSLDEVKEKISKYKQLLALAKENQLDDGDAKSFAGDAMFYSDKSFNVAQRELKQLAAKRAVEKEKRAELVKLATEAGLSESQAEDIANRYVNQAVTQAKREIQRLVDENEKRQKLTELAQSFYLEGDDNIELFVHNHLNSDIDVITAKVEKLKKLAKEYDLKKTEAAELISSGLDIADEQLGVYAERKLMRVVYNEKYKSESEEQYTGKEKYDFGYQHKVDYEEINNSSNGSEVMAKDIAYNDVLNQKYSIVTGEYYQDNSQENRNDEGINESYTIGDPTLQSYSEDLPLSKGLKTRYSKVPTEGSATYQGSAFSVKGEGALTYNVNFTTREGEGSITGLPDQARINLDKGEIQKERISGGYHSSQGVIRSTVSGENVQGKYGLAFFGPNAEEVAGKVTLSNNEIFQDDDSNISGIEGGEIGFGGSRSDIQK